MPSGYLGAHPNVEGALPYAEDINKLSEKFYKINSKLYWTSKGAKARAVIYSILETAKQNGLKPYDYLKYIFETMPSIQQKNYHTLLPWSASLPDYLRTGHHDKDTAENDKSE